MKIQVATCQFPVGANIRGNARYILRLMNVAKDRGADVAHFPEAGLSGYARSEFVSYKGFDWESLKTCTREILAKSSDLGLSVILGSTHPLTGNHKPHNSLYVINDKGEIVERYDKMFCSGDFTEKTGDLAHYTPGNHFATFTINGVRCGALICHDIRYPELYREYKRRGVQLVFHSYNAGHVSLKAMNELRNDIGKDNIKFNSTDNFPGISMPATVQGAATNNFVWISCSNSSARESCFASFFVRRDGIITGKLGLNRSGVLVSTVDTKAKLYDSSVAWRERAMKGIYHSGTLVRDKRSADRKHL